MGKKSSIILILIIILIVFGFFYWWDNREIKGNPEDYIIKETSEGTIVENERMED
jgi:uncharacterized protein YxeA